MFQDEKIDGHIISNDIAAVVGIVNFDVGQAQQSTQNEVQMCDPNNPKLNFVNSTESEIRGIDLIM